MTASAPTGVIVIGASSAIAQALIAQFAEFHPDTPVFAISRQYKDSDFPCVTQQSEHDCIPLYCDYTEASIQIAIEKIRQKQCDISHVFICNGLLHNDEISPEKRIEDINARHFEQTIQANVIVPTLWLQHLTALVTHQQPCKIVIFSARVGSIADNRLGGWYSYRASKAALNMIIKTAAIDYARRAKQTKLIAFHPGTTDTPLSKPFQSRVKPGALFTPQFVAQQLLSICDQSTADGCASFLDWQGKEIQW